MEDIHISILIAKILGPTLVILSLTEYLNFGIWSTKQPTLTYLNGLFFLIMGLILVNIHNKWEGWPILITVWGWMFILLGVIRMFFPNADQASDGIYTRLFLLFMGLMGLFLSFQGYLSHLLS